ncbi:MULTISPECIES: hypothetical protein [Serratia]|uniref:hypothetical protein n=1 Tax=Serratia TaxID=613 RepID=UPI00124F008A|nr:hypothetical protein [Serratia marcescens]QFH60845.1 hypothetical protein FR888_16915 [Serratia marcescens]
MELGSLTDWISSLSTAGTLLVAYMAYKKAPEWLKERNKQSGYDYALKIINDSVTIIDKLKIASTIDLLKNDSSSDNFNKVSNIMRIAFEIELLSDRLKDHSRYDIKLRDSNQLSDRYSSLMVYCMRLSRYYLNLATNLDTEEQLADMRKELDDIRTIFRKKVDDIFIFN